MDKNEERIWNAIVAAQQSGNTRLFNDLCSMFVHGRSSIAGQVQLYYAGLMDTDVKCVQTHYGMAL